MIQGDLSNKDRRARAALALSPYKDGDDLQSPVVDLLTDLRHYCHEYGVDFQKALRLATMHYEEEA